jgi:hypothetical protein
MNAKNSLHVRSLTQYTVNVGNAPGGFIDSIINELKPHTSAIVSVQVEEQYASKLCSWPSQLHKTTGLLSLV